MSLKGFSASFQLVAFAGNCAVDQHCPGLALQTSCLPYANDAPPDAAPSAPVRSVRRCAIALKKSNQIRGFPMEL
jgi:hypothetical protein